MHKALVVSFSLVLFVLFAGGAEAKQHPWTYALPIDGMTGEKTIAGRKCIHRY